MHRLQQGSLSGLALVFVVVGTCSGATAADLYATEVKLPDVVTNFSGYNISSPNAGDLCSNDVLSLLQTKSVIHRPAKINAREPLALAGRGKGPFPFDPEEVIHKSLAPVRQCLHEFLEHHGLMYYPVPHYTRQTLCKEGIMSCDTSILAQVTNPIDAFTNEKWKWFWFRTVPVVLAVLLVGCAGWFAHKSGTATRRTESWTGFRAFLATMIYLEHIGVHDLRGGGPFLLLSGAVMGLTTSNTRDVTTFRGYLTFVARRLIRIYPAYWLYLILSRDTMVSSSNLAELIQAVVHAPQEDFETFLGYQSWGGVLRNHLWFVSTIIALYLVFPFINAGLHYLGTKQDAKRCALVACCCFFCDVVFLTHHFLTPTFVPEVPKTGCNLYGLTELVGVLKNLYVPQGYMVHSVFGVELDFYVDPITRLPEFVLGITIGHMIQALSARKQPGQSGNDNPEWAGTQLARATDAAAIAVVVLVVLTSYDESKYYKYMRDSFGLGLVAPLFAFFLFGLGFSTVPSYAHKLLTLPFILELGKWSYGIYIWHPYVIMSFGCSFQIGAQTCDADRLVPAYAWTVLVAFASFKFVEEPSVKLLTRLLQQSK